MHSTQTVPFSDRHIGPRERDQAAMLAELGLASLNELTDQALPPAIRRTQPMDLPPALSERDALAQLAGYAAMNRPMRSCLGLGYYGTVTPPVILRNVLENPGWYTAYTPYQAEIAQGRLEALLNFQTMVSDLTGLALANASLLDEATAVAEAVAMAHRIVGDASRANVLVAGDMHPQTLGVVHTRCAGMGWQVRTVDPFSRLDFEGVFALLLQYPTTDGRVEDYTALTAKAHAAGVQVIAATDLLACVLLPPPGHWGADIAVGSSQRLGVPMMMGGPHAAFIATHEQHARKLPGRLVGVSRDARGHPAYRLAIQTREQHIKRDRATSNICTAQVLLAVVAGMYAVYHGPDGLRRIAQRVHDHTRRLADALQASGLPCNTTFFDTLTVRNVDAHAVIAAALERGINLRRVTDTSVAVSFDELTDEALVDDVIASFGRGGNAAPASPRGVTAAAKRQDTILSHPIFHAVRGEHDMLRYLKKLENKDLSLAHGMIPLGSCTMKLNATSQMIPVTWPGFADIHPYAPADQQRGYQKLIDDLCRWLGAITQLPAVSVQPNAGSQGEYAGLLAIRRYHAAQGQSQRDACLIPESAHGTNPASAVVAGMRVVPVACLDHGDIDVADLTAKLAAEGERVAALMVTYPSTHGVFEPGIREVCERVHAAGGLVYLDGANMNAQVGLTSPGAIGADVCHLNLHKTFCIPHGGGGPGVGPICATQALRPYLPGHPHDREGFAVAAAPYGSAGILCIPWMYIATMGREGLTRATQVAILNANYMANRLKDRFPLLFTGRHGRVAHEFILDLRPFQGPTGVSVEDVAKRLMDYGFHAPTMSWPVAGTLMIEPTESEPRAELDRFCEAMLSIRAEIDRIADGRWPRENHPLRHAPHPAEALTDEPWDHPYTREEAVYPLAWLREQKFWPSVARVDNPYGDRHLVCSCPPMDAHA